MPIETVAGEAYRVRPEVDQVSVAPGEEAVCEQCGETNADSRIFCRGCGRRLWDICPDCQARHRIEEKFCGQCGTDLRHRLIAIRERYEKQLGEAEASRQAGEFGRALAQLKVLIALDDVTYREIAQRAAALARETEADQLRSKQALERAEQEADQLLEAHRYRDAVAALERVPERLRSDAATQRLRDAQAKRDEVERLTAETQSLVRAKQLKNLAGRLDRLLELQPQQAFAQKLAHQLRDRLLAAAKHKLGIDDYPAALELLDQLPRSVPSPEAEALRDQAAELNWLIDDLKLSPVIDPPLVALAERMATLRPNHPQAGRLLEAIRQRALQPPDNLRHAAPAWAPPRTFRLGFPVHWWAGLQRIRCTADLGAQLRSEPGKYFVACGLALQGLGLAAVDINLLPPPASGLLNKLPGLRRQAPPNSAWGLDMGSAGLKAVRLVADPQQMVTLEAVESIPYPSALTSLTDEVERQALEREVIRQFVERRRPEADRVCLAVPGLNTLGRFLELPPVDPKKLSVAANTEAAFQFPADLTELAWGYHVFPGAGTVSADRTPRRTVMQAVKKQMVDRLIIVCQDLKLRLDVVQSECLALHNLAAYEYFSAAPGPAGDPSSVALLDVGARATNLVISSSAGTWFRSIGIAGESFTNALVRPLKMTREQAEHLKRNPARAHRMHRIYELLEAQFARLVDEVERSLQAYQRQYPGTPVRQMLGFGGGFRMHGLLRHLCRIR
jgi:type IV pilus assembly protein PilM